MSRETSDRPVSARAEARAQARAQARGDADSSDGRDETETERLDRNWNEILQETRVIQTGTQILTGFLLALAFQPRFADLNPFQVGIYLCLVSIAVIATVVALAPVALHRTLFRLKAKAELVRDGDRFLKVTLAAVGLTLVGTALLIFDVVLGIIPGIVAATIATALVVVGWVLVPLGERRRHFRG